MIIDNPPSRRSQRCIACNELFDPTKDTLDYELCDTCYIGTLPDVYEGDDELIEGGKYGN